MAYGNDTAHTEAEADRKGSMSVTDAKLRAYWIRNGIAQWVYPSEDESSMGSEYVIPYRIEIDIPTRLLED